MEKLSVVIITFNEEKNIDRCLSSVKEIADEIIVVDSFSTDKTKDICLKAGVKFEQKQWQGYSAMKNYANSLASYNLIFSLDADEVVSPELKVSILYVKDHYTQGAVYAMNRLNNYCGRWIRHGGWYPDRKIRVWDRRVGRWEGVVHEAPHFTREVSTILLNGDLLHYTYDSIQEHYKRVEKYALIAAKEMTARNKKTSKISIIFKPAYKFIYVYIFRLGFLDGHEGYMIAKISAHSVRTKLKAVCAE